MVTRAFGDLCDILGGIQQQLSQNSRVTPQLWEASIFMQELETWQQSLPNELFLPIFHGSQRTDPGLLENIIKGTPATRKVELVRNLSRS